MPALLTSTSIFPNCSTVRATPASTSCSLVTSMTTPIAVRRERKRRRARPRALERDVLEIIFDELADSRGAVDVRNDLEQKVRGRERSAHRVEVGGFVLVSHAGGGDADRAVVEGADHLIDLDVQRRLGELLGKAPKLAAARDRRLVVEEHAGAVAPLAAAEPHRNELSGFRIVARTRGIRPTDE